MIIYKVTSIINGKIYIGQTIRSLKKRQTCHFYDSTNRSNSHTKFHNAIKKYGKENFKWEIIDHAVDKQDLNKKEMYWIDFYNSFYEGYNSDIGGSSGPVVLFNESLLKKIYCNTNVSLKIIANIRGCSKATVRSELRRLNIYDKKRERSKKYVDINVLKELYTTKGMTFKEIESKTGINYGVVRNRLIENNVVIRDKSVHTKKERLQLNEKLIIKMYVEDEISLDAIGKYFNVWDETIKDRLIKNGIKIRKKHSFKKGYTPSTRKFVSVQKLLKMYIIENKSIKEIENYFNISNEGIRSRFIKLEVPRFREGQRNSPVKRMDYFEKINKEEYIQNKIKKFSKEI